jgi:hypothetical protein
MVVTGSVTVTSPLSELPPASLLRCRNSSTPIAFVGLGTVDTPTNSGFQRSQNEVGGFLTSFVL